MSGPEVVVAFDTEGAAKVKKELGATDKQLAKVNKQLERINERAALEELKNQSEAWKAATDRLAKAQGKLTEELTKQQKIFNKMGSFANKANEISQFAGGVLGAAKAVTDFAKAGAAAAAVADSFDDLGDAVPTLEALQAATAGVVSETTLQGYARMASEVGLTSEEMTGLAQRATTLAEETGRLGEVSEILNILIKGEAEGMRNLGVVVDLSAEQFAGMTEAQKKLAVAQEQAAQGSQKQVDAINNSQAAMMRAETQMADLVSDLQMMAVEALNNSGVFEFLSEAIEGIATFIDNNSSTFESLAETIGKMGVAAGQILGPALQNMAEMLDIALLVLQPFLDTLNFALETANSLRSAIPSLNEVAGDLFITDVPKFKSTTSDLNKELDGWLTRTQKQIDASKRAKEMQEEVRRDLELSKKSRQEENAIRAREIAAAERAAEALGRELEAINGLAHAIDVAVVKYGDEEAAMAHIEAKRKQVTAARFSASTMMVKAARAENEEQRQHFEERMSRLAEDEKQIEAVLSALGKQAAERDTITTGIDKETSAHKANTEALAAEAEAREFDMLVTELMIDQETQLAAQKVSRLEAEASAVAYLNELINESIPQQWERLQIAADEAAHLERKNELLAEAAELESQQIAGLQSLAKAGSLMAVSIGGATDKWGALNSAVVQSAAAFKQADSAQQRIGATLSAGKAITASVVDDTTTQAAILGAFEVAEAAANFMNPPAAAAHGIAAALYFGVAAKGGKGGGGGSAGAGGGGTAEAAQPAVADIAEEPTLPGRGPSSTVIFNIESLNPEGAGDSVATAFNSAVQSGSGIMLDPDGIGEQQGRSGL